MVLPEPKVMTTGPNKGEGKLESLRVAGEVGGYFLGRNKVQWKP